MITKLKSQFSEDSLQLEMTISACYNAYHFMVTADSSCTENCLKFDSEETENMEDFTSTDGGHILLETGNSA